jgi:hypothetical protein
MIIPIRARGTGKAASACARSRVVTLAMIVHSAVPGDCQLLAAGLHE